MKIIFVLPHCSPYPVGGFKIVYEYANRLAERGHSITVVHRKNPRRRRELLHSCLPPWRKASEHTSIAPWFDIRLDVRMIAVSEVTEETMPDADVVIATSWQTANWISGLGSNKGGKYYLIQHDEGCMGPSDAVSATWRLPLHKIVIAHWLGEKAEAMGEEATYIPNPIDFSRLRVETPLDARPPRIGMLFHANFEWKGSADGLMAIAAAKAKDQRLEAVVFGTDRRKNQIPRWMQYRRQPSPSALCEIYNKCSIFLQPSWTEGWGLTATESMACGCTLVTTENGGSRDYSIDGVTALVAPSHRPEALAEQILRLLSDDELRVRIAEAGKQYIQQYTWDSSLNLFECLLMNRRN